MEHSLNKINYLNISDTSLHVNDYFFHEILNKNSEIVHIKEQINVQACTLVQLINSAPV